jgi:2-hydroxy-6-oxonona-2,4-dienedioate hydrolase
MSFWTELNGVAHAIKWVEIDGIRLRYLEAGQGTETILFVHGLGGQLEVFIRNIAPLAPHYRILALDLPGHGHSDKPALSYEIEFYLWAVRGLLKRCDAPNAHFVGLAMGAWICSRLAARHPERVKTLTLIAPAGLRSDPTIMNKMKHLSAQTSSGRDAVRARLEWLLRAPSDWSEELIDVRWAIYGKDDYQTALPRMMCLQDPAIRTRNLLGLDELRAVSAPTLIAMAEDDPAGSSEDGKLMARTLSRAATHIFPHSRHMPNFEEPEPFNALLLAFLRDPDKQIALLNDHQEFLAAGNG